MISAKLVSGQSTALTVRFTKAFLTESYSLQSRVVARRRHGPRHFAAHFHL